MGSREPRLSPSLCWHVSPLMRGGGPYPWPCVPREVGGARSISCVSRIHAVARLCGLGGPAGAGNEDSRRAPGGHMTFCLCRLFIPPSPSWQLPRWRLLRTANGWFPELIVFIRIGPSLSIYTSFIPWAHSRSLDWSNLGLSWLGQRRPPAKTASLLTDPEK